MSDGSRIPTTHTSARRYWVIAALVAVGLMAALLVIGRGLDADTVGDNTRTCKTIDKEGQAATDDAARTRLGQEYIDRGCHIKVDGKSLDEQSLGLVDEGEPCGPDGIALTARVNSDGFLMLCWDRGDGVNRWHVDPRQFYAVA